MVAPTDPIETCPVAFKEWAGVVDAIGSGRQSLILRKGGIAEGPEGFRPEYPAFWLYPTHVHEAEQGLRDPALSRIVETPGRVGLEFLAVVEWVGRVDRLDRLDAIRDLHGWTDATVRTRFHYRTPGLWALAVRAYHRSEPWPVTITPAHLGCKTWVPLESPPPMARLVPVLGNELAGGRRALIRSAIEGGPN
jgi:hypothetical protein